jgi:glycosyltransferase involved in cell wall biosynthesis
MADTLILLSNIDFRTETGASYARVMNYARALSASGTEVILTSKLNRQSTSIELRETGIKGVTYLGTPMPRVKKKINDVYLENLYFLVYFRYLRKISRLLKSREGATTFLLYPGSLALMVVALLYLKILKGKKVFVEKNEMMAGIALNYPLSNRPVKFVILSLVKLFLFVTGLFQDLLTPCFTGIIAISSRIEKLYRRFNSSVIRIPILCEGSSNIDNPNALNRFSIGYTGDINQNKDGLFSFIRVLGKLKSTHEFDFFTWGSVGGKTQFSKLSQLIDELGLNNQIHYQGLVKSSELATAIANLDLLVLPRPLNFQTQYGFSTKLGEYMISGIPVLATDVSDNSNYITDGQNGFIVRPEDETAMLDTLKRILETSKMQLKQTGLNGKETAIQFFDARKYSEAMNELFFRK